MSAYAKSSVVDFLTRDSRLLLGDLTHGAQESGFAQQLHSQTEAWEKEISHLQKAFRRLEQSVPESANWGVLLEYPIPRRQKRIDAVLLACDIVFVLEFKIGTMPVVHAAFVQVEDYCLDLRDFHAESHGRLLVPVLIASEATEFPHQSTPFMNGDKVLPVVTANAELLVEVITGIFIRFHKPAAKPINLHDWDMSSYKPVPTIIEAAEQLYADHSVREIAHAHANIHNLTTTTRKLIEAVQDAQAQKKKIICFVTGVPGSGKTLTGLTTVHSPELKQGGYPAGVFLSGNGPLVRIVSEALARDKRDRTETKLGEARRVVTAFIQNVHSFLKQYVDENPSLLPYEHVVVFDEAQRAWDREKSLKKFGRSMSEPMTMLSVMDRHKDWAVIIALVGGGQEIYEGEAGLAEWGRALIAEYSHWEIRVSQEVLTGGSSVAGNTLFDVTIPASILVTIQAELHLPVSVRSYKAEGTAEWVNAVLEGKPETAYQIATGVDDFPIYLSRSLEGTREMIRRLTRGSRRCGLVISSGAMRLRAYGLEVSLGFRRGYPYEEWFLAPRSDFRSSYQLEVAATEFECQGLELDWVGVCWGDDFTWSQPRGSWDCRKLVGSRWSSINKERDRQYLLNRYRVLLTRAREGMIIWVPKGDEQDPTRDPDRLNATAAYLLQCGVKAEIDQKD